MAKLVSKTYGDALFAVAVEENKMDLFFTEVQDVSGSFTHKRRTEQINESSEDHQRR